MDDHQPHSDTHPRLFPELAEPPTGSVAERTAPELAAESSMPSMPSTPRLRRPQREQGEMFMESLDQRIEVDHPVRVVWSFVEKLDLSTLLERIKAVEGHQGRDANDPRMLLTLWL